ncbi:hypothetical protein [Pseudoduganella chitinolytica]|uniref:Uncharacterized protein n=1 Tax=Pseudoduganella chitinolytica TaxID=34070 RepID=A0ABY8BH11_9BURK|nr:hypothetical protein [Pseudoduganella chitinolytica]WEF34258.1 hypothetical protein PX653_05665 [Pseudoduganella chitinolytica]
MLNIIDALNSGEFRAEFGDYLPFKLCRENHSHEWQLYWQTGDFKSSFLEISIGGISYAIIEICLLLPGKVIRKFPVVDLQCVNSLTGIPVVNTTDWPDVSIKDEPGTLRVFLDAGRLLINLSASTKTERLITSGGITFGLDAESSLAWIQMSNMKFNFDKMVLSDASITALRMQPAAIEIDYVDWQEQKHTLVFRNAISCYAASPYGKALSRGSTQCEGDYLRECCATAEEDNVELFTVFDFVDAWNDKKILRIVAEAVSEKTISPADPSDALQR